jgi:flavin reductase (DIM6/NTAB) family NADH-FMN oxidoreductase RutF
MELPWNDRRTRQFLTNVGLITTDGPYGPNVMAAEWTMYLASM